METALSFHMFEPSSCPHIICLRWKDFNVFNLLAKRTEPHLTKVLKTIAEIMETDDLYEMKNASLTNSLE